MKLQEAVTEFLGLVRLGSQALNRIAANEPAGLREITPDFDQIKFHLMRIEEVADEMAVRIAQNGSLKLS